MQPLAASGVTLELARRALTYRADTLPSDILSLASQCVLDWFSVTIAALNDPVHLSLMAVEKNARCGDVHIIGHAGVYSTSQAALVNGATAHALDFDDVNISISGHPSAVIFSALLALAEKGGNTGLETLSAFVAGYETACQIGALVCPDHLIRGFHATGTVSGFGAAVACAHLLGFNPQQTALAMGIAGTQASGLKSMFGTMVKPLHAGLAARRGVEAALLVAHGFDSRSDILECKMGFADTHSSDFNIESVLDRDPFEFHLRNNLFKYEASCFGTHAAIECVRRLQRSYAFHPDDVEQVTVRADAGVDTICNIQSPATGLQGKFSLRLTTAFALLGIDTGDIANYSDAQVGEPQVVALRDKMAVQLVDGWPAMQSEVEIKLKGGQSYRCIYDAGEPSRDLDTQRERLEKKFSHLVQPVLGTERSSELLARIRDISDMRDMGLLSAICACSSN